MSGVAILAAFGATLIAIISALFGTEPGAGVGLVILSLCGTFVAAGIRIKESVCATALQVEDAPGELRPIRQALADLPSWVARRPTRKARFT